MIAAFVIWSCVAVVFLVISISARKSKKPVGFWTNGKVPEVNDTRSYNKDVSVLWAVFAGLMEIVGIPLLFCEQNSPIAVLPILGTVLLIIGIMVWYNKIENKHRKK